jgi:hypothetical protein
VNQREVEARGVEYCGKMDQHSAIPNDATCLGCGYALRDLPEPRCPECGREFDPAESWSFHRGRHLKKWEQRLFQPPGWLMIGAALVACLLMLWACSPPGVYGEPLLIASFIWLLIGLAWLIRFFAAAIIRGTSNYVSRAPKSDAVRWSVIPLSIFLTCAMCIVGIPLTCPQIMYQALITTGT